MRLRRPLLSSAAALIALSTLSGFAARAEDAQQNAAPKAETGQPMTTAQGADENRKTSGSNDQSGPSNAAPTANQDTACAEHTDGEPPDIAGHAITQEGDPSGGHRGVRQGNVPP